MKANSLFFFLVVLGLSGCYYDNEEELYPGGQTCDLTEVTYSLDVSPIVQRSCLQCHSNAAINGGVTLEGYENLKVYVNNGKLTGSINHASGFSPMPKDAQKLRDCDIAIIEKWIENGVLND